MKRPNINFPEDNKYSEKVLALSLLAAMAIVAVSALDPKDKTQNHSNKPKQIEQTVLSGQQILEGGIIIDARVARGVVCPKEQHDKIPVSWFNTTSDQLTTDPDFTAAENIGYYGYGPFLTNPDSSTPTIFAGLQSASEFEGLYPLSEGFSLTYNGPTQTYTLGHFDSEKTGTKPDLTDKGSFSVGKIVVKQLMTTNLEGIEMGKIGTWTDGKVNVSVSTYPTANNLFIPPTNLEPNVGIELDVNCVK